MLRTVCGGGGGGYLFKDAFLSVKSDSSIVKMSYHHKIYFAYCTNVCLFFPTVNTPHFLTIKGVEVNAGQTASFHCTVNGRKRDNFRLWLQVRKRCCYLVFYTVAQNGKINLYVCSEMELLKCIFVT